MKKVQFKSDFLFPDTDFITGMGSVLNIAGNYFEFSSSKTEQIADSRALKSDWGVVGQDIKDVMNNNSATINNAPLETCA